MKKKNLIVLAFSLVLCAALFTGCIPEKQAAAPVLPQPVAAQPEEVPGNTPSAPADAPVIQVLSAEEIPTVTEPITTDPAATEPPVTESAPSVPSSLLCPICGDLDCDDGKYCDDAHEKAENLKEYERLMNGDLCDICGDYDCDDGKYCDDADEKAENLREAEAKKAALSGKTTTKATTKTTTSATSGLCPICADDDCDDGKYCDDADERAENLREAENKKNGVRCPVCGDYDCDDGKYCDDWDDRYDDDDDD